MIGGLRGLTVRFCELQSRTLDSFEHDVSINAKRLPEGVSVRLINHSVAAR